MIKQPVPKVLRDLVLPPYTDGKAKMIERVFRYSSLYNQSDVQFAARIVGFTFAAMMVWYFFM